MGSPCQTPLEEEIQEVGVPLIRKEKEVDLRQVLIQEIQVLGNFILARVARIAVQLRVPYAF